ncbi:MIP/aquaporin family protein [Polaromonas sp.]|uniref:aquaporin n=1 Tax=Polaromonas sp. TaxID=1869339 RepID=UPI0024895427|nr:MIP/aquaporin family protein [Polaromonas sp.]MDI1342086.1 aquaporin family protein [Polaromonas sp.]
MSGAASTAALPPLAQRLFAEFLGTAGLLCAVIGSGIMAERLAGGNTAIALLANTLATVFALYVLIETLGPVSGAHLNPVVTLVIWSKTPSAHAGRTQTALFFIAFQLAGAVLGAWLANAMFDMSVLQVSNKLRGGWGQWLAEAVATAGLILVILRAPVGKASALVACYIGAAYWFTASTSFANPAAVLGRILSDSFAGISPASAPGFVIAEVAGAALGVLLDRGLDGRRYTGQA